jgi:hypothetical protein
VPRVPGVRDANGQALAYLYSRDNEDERRGNRNGPRSNKYSTEPAYFRDLFVGRRCRRRQESFRRVPDSQTVGEL